MMEPLNHPFMETSSHHHPFLETFVDEALGHSDHTTPLAEIFDVIDHPSGQGAWGAAALACHGEDGFAAKKPGFLGTGLRENP